ncbi:MAG: hypothetical protein AABX16_04385 [Nanoarchaeota archaeon]
MNKKKGQVSFFIILGVVIVAFIGLYLFLSGKIYLGKSIPLDIQPVHSFVSMCLEQSTREAVIAIGFGGGYYPRSAQATSSGVVYFFNDENNIPSKKMIEESLSLYIQEFMPFCIDDFADFKDINVSADAMKVTTQISEDSVVVHANYPLSVVKGKSVYTLENFESSLHVRLDTIMAVSEKIVKEHVRANAVCIDCLGRFSDEYGIVIAFDDYEEDTTIYTILDEYSLNETYAFIFAIKSSEVTNEKNIFGD